MTDAEALTAMAIGTVEFDPSVVDASTLVRRMQADAAHGLTAAEAERRLASAGPNEIVAAKPVPTWRKILEQFRDPLIYLLLAAIVISLAAWLIEGAAGWPFGAIVIAVIVVVNAVLGYVQEARAERGRGAPADDRHHSDGRARRCPAARA